MPTSRKKSITELAAILKAAHDLVESSADDDIGMENMEAVYAAEALTLATPFTQAQAIEANHQILHQYGDPNWGDEFHKKLGRKILNALLPEVPAAKRRLPVPIAGRRSNAELQAEIDATEAFLARAGYARKIQ